MEEQVKYIYTAVSIVDHYGSCKSNKNFPFCDSNKQLKFVPVTICDIITVEVTDCVLTVSSQLLVWFSILTSGFCFTESQQEEMI